MKAGIALLTLVLGLGHMTMAQGEAVSDVAVSASCQDGLLLPVAAKSQEVQSSVIAGIGHLVSFWDEAAYRDFRKALDADPDCLMANWGLALSLIAPFDERSEEREAALKSLQRLLDTTPATEQEALYAKALYALFKDGPQVAGEVFREISERWKNDHIAVLMRAMMVREGFDEEGSPRVGQVKAREILDRLLEEQPNLFAAHFGRALIEETSPVVDESVLAHARRAVELVPSYPPAHLLLGHFLFRSGKYEEAVQSFDRSARLYQQWADGAQIPMADNDGYFRSMVYRATSEWCKGDVPRAMETATKLAAIPIDKKRPLAKGSIIQEWEVKTLPLRFKLSEHPAPSIKECSPFIPQITLGEDSEVQDLAMACMGEFAKVREAFRQRDTNALRMAFSYLDRMESFLGESGDGARVAGSLSYWARSLWMAERMVLEAKAMVFADSADVWLQNAADSQQYASLLLPPILPYPAEWKMALHQIGSGAYQEAVKSCEQGLSRFPAHAGVMTTLELAKKKLSSGKDEPSPPKMDEKKESQSSEQAEQKKSSASPTKAKAKNKKSPRD